MTNIKSHGFRSKAELDDHLRELEDDAPAEDSQSIDGDADELSSGRKQVVALRAELDELRQRLTSIPRQTPEVGGSHAWLCMAAALVTTLVLGELVRRRRFARPEVGAVTQIERLLR